MNAILYIVIVACFGYQTQEASTSFSITTQSSSCPPQSKASKAWKSLPDSLADKRLAIYIRSEGCNDPGITGCGYATIRVNGINYSKRSRGYNVVVVNGNTGSVESSASFDTYGDGNAKHGLLFFLNKIPRRKLVLVAIQDAAANQMSDAAYNAFRRFGARSQLRYKVRNSYALLGWSGYGVLDVVTQVQCDRYKGPSTISKVISLPLF